jgi:glycosyltransferase involved in cell wall biosynthesis
MARRAGGPVTVLAVHNRYREFGGEDVAFEAETQLLEEHGHRVERVVVDNDRIPDDPSVPESTRLAVRTIWSPRAAALVARRVRAAGAGVVHVHNFFPLLSPAIYSAARAAGAAVVQTLHNYRLICPVATLYRDGHVCEDCVGRPFAWPGVVHACYRGSVSASAAVATMLAANRIRGTWRRDVDLYLAVSDFIRTKLVEGLLPADLVAVKPNFVADPGPSERDPGAHFLYVGRLSEDKGIETLLDAWRLVDPRIGLRIVGDGPLAGRVAAAAVRLPNVTWVGRVAHEGIIDELHAARALVFPSRWYEGMPLVIVEAFAAGRPVIASRLGTAGELVSDATGTLFPAGDPVALARAVSWFDANADAAAARGFAARERYLEAYSPERNYPLIAAFYAEAIRRHEASASRQRTGARARGRRDEAVATD